MHHNLANLSSSTEPLFCSLPADKREIVSSMGRYIDLMDEELLQGLEAPEVDQRNRKALVTELQSRLHDIGR